MTLTFGKFLQNAFAVWLCRKSEDFFCKLKGFFRRALL